MCAVGFLDQLEAAGICSYKIEGRMKTPFYVATAVNAYRHAIDGDVPMEVIERELDSISHRPYSSAFYFGEMKMSHGNSGAYIQKCTFIGKVLDYSDGFVTIQQRNNFKPGDELEVVSPISTGEKFTVTAIYDEESKLYRTKDELKSEILQVAHHGLPMGGLEFVKRNAEFYKIIDPEICLFSIDGKSFAEHDRFTNEKWVDNQYLLKSDAKCFHQDYTTLIDLDTMDIQTFNY
jgi:hypothetical protein